ncbi:hypothetical protein D3C84_647480 [compost metagenome]
MVEIEKVVDHAQAWNLRRGRRDQKQQKEEQRDGVALAFSRDGHDDGGNGCIHPEAVRDEDQERQHEPQIAATREVAVGDKVRCSPA